MNDQHNDTLKYSLEQFDKSVIYVASGCLGVSFAFIKDIITDLSKAVCKNWLITSWMIFAFVIFISLVAHWISYIAHLQAERNYHLEDKLYNKIINQWSWSIRIMNFLTILGILIGALYLFSFIKVNL